MKMEYARIIYSGEPKTEVIMKINEREFGQKASGLATMSPADSRAVVIRSSPESGQVTWNGDPVPTESLGNFQGLCELEKDETLTVSIIEMQPYQFAGMPEFYGW